MKKWVQGLGRGKCPREKRYYTCFSLGWHWEAGGRWNQLASLLATWLLALLNLKFCGYCQRKLDVVKIFNPGLLQ
jgi:hypothetical protein